MIGKELHVLERLEEQPKRELAAIEASAPVRARRIGIDRKGVDRAVQPDHPAGRGGRPGRPARLRPYRVGPAVLRRGPGRPRAAQVDGGHRGDAYSPDARWPSDIAFCSENRRAEGLVEELTVRENIILAHAGASAAGPDRCPAGRHDELVAKYIAALRHHAGRSGHRRRGTSAAATSRRCCWPGG